MKATIFCNKAYCDKTKEIEWDGKFIDKWYCEKCKAKEKK
jgi:hypothetical protein